MDLRDSMLTDLRYEIDNVDFRNADACNDSYEYIRTNFLIAFKSKDTNDVSISESDKEEFLRILDSESGNLLNCYLKLTDHLEKIKRRTII